MAKRSDLMTKGPERAPHRSLLRAEGFTDWEMERPIIGIANSFNEIIPGHSHLDKLVDAVKAGVYAAGGTPVVFNTIGVCDGIAMNHVGMKYSLPSRELIADSLEIMAMAHPFDGLVMMASCDKIIPGMLIAAARLNIPSIFLPGGPMLPGRVLGRDTGLDKVFEAVGRYKAGKISAGELKKFECAACPGAGSCSGMFTANTMSNLSEALGHDAAARRQCAGRLRRPHLDRQADRPGGRAAREEPDPAAGHHDPRGLPQRHRDRHGARRLDQQRAAPAGHRLLRRGGCHPGGLRQIHGQNPAPDLARPGRPAPRRGFLPRRRHSRRHGRAAQGRPDPREVPDRLWHAGRQDARRHQGRHPGPGGHPHPERPGAPHRGAWRC